MAEEAVADLPTLTLERGSGTPAHVQIQHWIMDAIDQGEIGPGDRLPGERDLSATLGVSRMTLRQALAELERQGVLVRVPGRSGGAFVAEPQIDCDLTGLAGFTEQMRRAHRRAGARILRAETVEAPRTVGKALEIAAGAKVHEIVRVRSADQTPLAIERSYFPASTFPDLLERDLAGSIYELLRDAYEMGPHSAVEHLVSVTARPDEAAELGIDPGDPLMLIERTASARSGLPVEFARDLYRSDRVRITVHSTAP